MPATPAPAAGTAPAPGTAPAAGTAAAAAIVPVPPRVASNVAHIAKAITNIALDEYPPFLQYDEEESEDLWQPPQAKCQGCKAKAIVCNIDGTVPNHKRLTKQGEVRPHCRALYDHVYRLRYEVGKGKGEWPIKPKVELKWRDLDKEFPPEQRSEEFANLVTAAKKEERAETLKARAHQVHWVGKVPSYAESVKLTKKLVDKWTKAENKQAHWVWTVTRLHCLYCFKRSTNPHIQALRLPPPNYQPPIHLPRGTVLNPQEELDAAAQSDGEDFDDAIRTEAAPNPLLSLPGLDPDGDVDMA